MSLYDDHNLIAEVVIVSTFGGGLFVGNYDFGDPASANLRLTNSTISENLSIDRILDGSPVAADFTWSEGGGVAGYFDADLQIRHSTITQNFTYDEFHETSGVLFIGNNLDIGHSIIADNPDAFVDDDPQSFTYDPVASSDLDTSFQDPSGALTVMYSIIGDYLFSGLAATSSPTQPETENSDIILNIVGGPNNQMVNSELKLDVLAYNGGPTKTHALLSESSAIDIGMMGFNINSDSDGDGPLDDLLHDQRDIDYDRLVTRIDIGAFESQ